MTTEIWAAIFTQIPVTAAFIWFSLEMQKRNAETMDKRDMSFEKRNDSVVAAIVAHTSQLAELTKVIVSHDARLRGGE